MWGGTTIVSDNGGFSTAPGIATDSLENAHIAWQDSSDVYGAGADLDIFYRKLYKNGTLADTLVLSDNMDMSLYPSIAADILGNVHVAWMDRSNINGSIGTNFNIFYRKWSGSWSNATIISDMPNATVNSGWPYIEI